MFALKFDLESRYALEPNLESEEKWTEWIDECLKAVEAIHGVLSRNNAPATFFVVGEVLERAGADLGSLLSDPLFEIQSHSYTHMHIKDDDPNILSQFENELEKTAQLIHRYFGKPPRGFAAPGGFYRGLRGYQKQLAILKDQGYVYVNTDASGPPEQWMPAQFTQPYWYDEEGFPEILEVPVTGWHCNMLFNTGHQNDNWKPAAGFPDGTVMERLPVTIQEGFEARRKELQYAIDKQLIYLPAMHPWSVYRFDPELEHLERLIAAAREQRVPVVNCGSVYEQYKNATGKGDPR